MDYRGLGGSDAHACGKDASLALTQAHHPADAAIVAPHRPVSRFPWHTAGFIGLLLLTIALRFPLLNTIPVGLHFDEAFSGVDAAAVSWTYHPIFFTDSNGMEPLYLYLQAISIALFGRTPFALRVVSAALGTLTVPALYVLVRRLTTRNVGLFAAAILAVTYWHVHVSRLGYRAIALPLFECLAWWALWNGVQRRDWRWLAAGGGFIGVSLYTYSTARAFPLAIILWFLWLALRRRDVGAVGQLVLVGAAALVVFSPLGWYFVQHPEEFINRVGQVVVLSPGVSHSGQPAALIGIEKTLLMFSFHGDPQWKYNLSGKPTFDPLMSLFFYAGIVYCLVAGVRLWRSQRRSASTASSSTEVANQAESARSLPDADGAALLLIWFVVMLIPGFVTTNPPETLHTLGVVPVVCTFPALGCVWLWRLAMRRMPNWRRAGPALAAALVVAEAISTAISYFVIWAPNPQTYYWLHGDVADIARILQRAPANATLYIATQYYRHPTVRFLAPNVAAHAVWFEADKSLPVAPGNGPAIYAFANGYQPLAAAGGALPSADLVAAPRDSAGGVKYRVYQLPGPATLPALQTPLNVSLGGDVELLDAEVQSPTAAQPHIAEVSLRWRVLRVPTRKLSLFVHLLDASGYRWAQSDGQGVFSTDWRPGEEVLTTETIQLPVGTPPVPLQASVDFYDVASGALLAPAGAVARAPDGGVIVGALTPLPSATPARALIPGSRPATSVAPGVDLIGVQLPAAPVKAGSAADIVLYLQKTAADGVAGPTLTLDGSASDDHDPLASNALLAALPVGDVLAVHHQLMVPARDAAATGLVQIAPVSGAAIPIGTIAIRPLPRSFTAPVPQHPLAVQFADVAELVGYDLQPDTAGKRLSVTLYWKALQPSNTAYTVFVHLVTPAGVLAGQHDSPPANDEWPTTTWLPGQSITDTHILTLTNAAILAQDELQVGLYNPAAPGQPRLAAAGPPGQAAGTYATLPIRG